MERVTVILSFLFVISSKTEFGKGNVCGDGSGGKWVSRNGFCYFFYTASNYLTWEKALQYCQDIQTNLVSIHSQSEAEFLIARLQEYGVKGSSLWTGLHKPESKTSYAWSDGTEGDYFSWNSISMRNMTDEDFCIYMNITNGRLDAAHCDCEMQFICKVKEKQLVDKFLENSPNTEEGFCPTSWRNIGNNCYKIFGLEQPKTWMEAEISCVNQSAILVTIFNITVQEQLADLLQDSQFDVWIGLKYSHVLKKHEWSDKTNANFSRFLSENSVETVQNRNPCVAIKFKENSAKVWSHNNCENKKGYICQLSEVKDIPVTAPLLRLPYSETIGPGSLVAIIMSSMLGSFILCTIAFIIYKRSLPRRILAIRNRVFNRPERALRPLI